MVGILKLARLVQVFASGPHLRGDRQAEAELRRLAERAMQKYREPMSQYLTSALNRRSIPPGFGEPLWTAKSWSPHYRSQAAQVVVQPIGPLVLGRQPAPGNISEADTHQRTANLLSNS
jgi:hypothetical protein